MIKKLLIVLSGLIFFTASAQRPLRFVIDLPKDAGGLYVPVSADIGGLISLPDTLLSLTEIQGSKKIPVGFQVGRGGKRTLYWLVKSDTTATKHIFELKQGHPPSSAGIKATIKDGALTVHIKDKDLLRYRYKTVYPPAGIDTAFKRSAFIHPLWSPHGQELTRIQPPDHYHHYGIWNPWTHVYFENDTVDFWNIKGRQGTVRFARFNSVTDGNVFAGFSALHEHVVFKKDGSEKVALNEEQTVRVYKPADAGNYFIVDITSELTCASESPFLILAYRYAGFSWRTTEYWDNKNCEVLTSEGRTRKDTDGSKARWCIVQGALPGDDYGGAAILSYPANYNHPEPMRIWGESQNGRGDMFFNFAPTKDKDWLLQPGKTYTLKYRMVVFNGKFDAAKAEGAWQHFAEPPKVNIINTY